MDAEFARIQHRRSLVPAADRPSIQPKTRCPFDLYGESDFERMLRVVYHHTHTQPSPLHPSTRDSRHSPSLKFRIEPSPKLPSRGMEPRTNQCTAQAKPIDGGWQVGGHTSSARRRARLNARRSAQQRHRTLRVLTTQRCASARCKAMVGLDQRFCAGCSRRRAARRARHHSL